MGCARSSAASRTSATSTPVNGSYGGSTGRAVLAFRKVNGFARTTSAGRVGVQAARARWRRLQGALPQGRQARGVRLVAAGARARARRTAADHPPHVVRRALDADRVRQVPLLPKAPGLQLARACTTRTTSSAGTRSTATRPVPTYPASHGCLRIPIASAKRVYALGQPGRHDLHLPLSRSLRAHVVDRDRHDRDRRAPACPRARAASPRRRVGTMKPPNSR